MGAGRAWSFALCMAASSAGAAQPAADFGMPAMQGAIFGQGAVSDSRLSNIRGGYDLGSGLVASFGIDRAVYINSNLVADINVEIPDLAHIDDAQANALATLVNGVTLIRNGPGNFVDPVSFDRVTGAIAIQNTLDNQQIQALTTLNATVRNLNQFRSLNLANTLQQALINSRGP